MNEFISIEEYLKIKKGESSNDITDIIVIEENNNMVVEIHELNISVYSHTVLVHDIDNVYGDSFFTNTESILDAYNTISKNTHVSKNVRDLTDEEKTAFEKAKTNTSAPTVDYEETTDEESVEEYPIGEM